MVIIKNILTLSIILSSTYIGFSQDKQIDNKRLELEMLKSEIQSIESDFKQSTAKEKQSVRALDKLSRQSYLINKLILNLKKEEEIKSNQIKSSEQKISSIQNEIDKLKSNYKKYVVSIYKTGKVNELASLIDSKSIGQAILRYKYLKEFSRQRRNDLERFHTNKEELIAAKKQLEVELQEKQKLVEEKSAEEKSLKAKLTDQKKLVDRVKKDKAALSKRLKEKKNAEKQIADLIVRLVEDAEKRQRELERKRSERLLATTNTNTNAEIYPEYSLDLNTAAFRSFSELKGKLNWPVRRGKVIGKFGEFKNPILRTITINNGIDIKAAGDLNVYAVIEGVISAVEWIPGYGSVVIVSHRGNYRTVYSHLEEIFVNEGDKVSTGTVIAKVGQGMEGTVLHFEIWNSRQNVDPEDWLK